MYGSLLFKKTKDHFKEKSPGANQIRGFLVKNVYYLLFANCSIYVLTYYWEPFKQYVRIEPGRSLPMVPVCARADLIRALTDRSIRFTNHKAKNTHFIDAPLCHD